ncbi:MAG: hypothetical protein K2O34_13840 [Acetatifactor sp.]|nr:hypothetical protein [Acetatifactor sp.]
MNRKTACILIAILSLSLICSVGGYLFIQVREHTVQTPQNVLVQNDTQSTVPSSDSILPEAAWPDVTGDESVPFRAAPSIPDTACFTYEELTDGTLRITGYDENKNTENPYQVIIPSTINEKMVSTLGTGAISADNLVELVISDGITTLEHNIFASGWDPCLVVLPDSVVHIDKMAFYSIYGSALPLVISCGSETSYAYEYAVSNGFACQLVNPVTEVNAFLQDYAISCHNSAPYLCHICEKGDLYDYVVIEYLDIADRLQIYMDSHSYFSTSYIWDDNEFAVLVLDKESGTVLQCIDTYSFHDPEKICLYLLSGVYCQKLLSIADWNFDGIEDICLNQGYDGTGADNYYAVFLFDKDGELYTEARDFPMNNIQLVPDKQCIDSSYRSGPAEHYIDRYQYVDGKLTLVATLCLYDFQEDGASGAGVRDERLVDGEWQIYREETILLGEDHSAQAYDNAYEQLKHLYVDDGYWDL